MKYITVLIIVLSLVGCASNTERKRIYTNYHVTSYVNINLSEVNSKLANIPDEDLSPYQLILRIMSIGSEQQEFTISQVYSNIEEKNESKITVVQEGYLDDSIRGEWNEFELKINKDNKWEVVKAKRAYLCWRQSSKEYQRRLCQ